MQRAFCDTPPAKLAGYLRSAVLEGQQARLRLTQAGHLG